WGHPKGWKTKTRRNPNAADISAKQILSSCQDAGYLCKRRGKTARAGTDHLGDALPARHEPGRGQQSSGGVASQPVPLETRAATGRLERAGEAQSSTKAG